MSGAIPVLPLYALMTCMGKTLPLTLPGTKTSTSMEVTLGTFVYIYSPT